MVRVLKLTGQIGRTRWELREIEEQFSVRVDIQNDQI